MWQWHGRQATIRFTTALMVLSLLVIGCGNGGDDFVGGDDDFVGVDVEDVENTTFVFTDGRVFGLDNQPVRLVIGTFGDGALEDDEAVFTLTAIGEEAEGTLDLDEGDVPVLRDFSECAFRIAESSFDVAGLQPGNTVETDCNISEDGTELRLERDGEISTGELQQ